DSRRWVFVGGGHTHVSAHYLRDLNVPDVIARRWRLFPGRDLPRWPRSRPRTTPVPARRSTTADVGCGSIADLRRAGVPPRFPRLVAARAGLPPAGSR